LTLDASGVFAGSPGATNNSAPPADQEKAEKKSDGPQTIEIETSSLLQFNDEE